MALLEFQNRLQRRDRAGF